VIIKSDNQAETGDPDTAQKAKHDKAKQVFVVSLPPVDIIRNYKGFWGFLYDWGQWFFASILAIVGGFQAWLLHRTWKTIERQTKSFINKERSRLFLTSEITPDFEITVTAVNRGQSPARVTYKFVGCEILDKGESLPDIPRYTERGEPAEDYAWDEWAIPKRPIRIGRYDASYIVDPKNPELNGSVLSGKYVVWFYGIVIYQDSVSEDEHSIKFCYRCSLFENGKPWLLDDGPATYRGET